MCHKNGKWYYSLANLKKFYPRLGVTIPNTGHIYLYCQFPLTTQCSLANFIFSAFSYNSLPYNCPTHAVKIIPVQVINHSIGHDINMHQFE